MKTYTSAFEKWWNQVVAASPCQAWWIDNENHLKPTLWLTWRTAREKLYEEMPPKQQAA